MSVSVRLQHPADAAGWRRAARELLRDNVAPHDVVWDARARQDDLFADADHATPNGADSSTPAVSVPASFLELAERVVCHRATDRFATLYRVLWRHARGEQGLLANPLDDDMHRLAELSRAVARDRHKMHAFVRFRRVSGVAREQYVAWFEPDHFIVRLTSGFFQRRFANMCWSILTPDESAHWDGHELVFDAGSERSGLAGDEPVEALWKTYFANIFNPARLRVDAMCSEMPVKYWKNLPEAPLIASLIHDSGTRHTAMLAALPSEPARFAARAMAPAARSAPVDPMPRSSSLAELRQKSSVCTRCAHACRATQTVHGEGPERAGLMLVGEQAGDQEDLQGRPFVGPAGQLLRTLLAELDMPAKHCYLSNAVRHFDYVPKGQRRLHRTPNADVIERCRPWLFEEIRLVSPQVVVGLGASAARSLTGRVTRISEARGVLSPFDGSRSLLLTLHPAAVLRERDGQARALARASLKRDLMKACVQARTETWPLHG